MRKHSWRHLGGAKLKVLISARDLGSQVSYGVRAFSGLSSTRLSKACRVAQHVQGLPCPSKLKVRLLRGKAGPMGLYGAEAAPVNERGIRSLGHAFKKAITPGTTIMASQALSFACWGWSSPDPRLIVLLRRAAKLRMMWHASTELRAQIQRVFEWHVQSSTLGIACNGSYPAALAHNMVVRDCAGAFAVRESAATGPVALLLGSLHRVGIALDSQWHLLVRSRACVHFLLAPWNHVTRLLRDAYLAGVTHEVSTKRESMQGGSRVDWGTTLRYPKGTSPQHVSLLKAVHAGAMWTPHEMAKTGLIDSPKCRECGCPRADLEHLLWHCPFYEEHRQQCKQALGTIQPEDLPRSLALHGLAPELSGASIGPLWASEGGEGHFYVDPWITAHFGEHVDASVMTARFISDWIAGQVPSPVCPRIPREGALPPREPNIFTDGSLVNGKSSIPRAGAGLWMDRDTRPCLSNPASPIHDLVHEHAACAGGCWAPVIGPCSSSTRAEVLAFLLALMAPGSAHICTDSQALVQGFAFVLKALAMPESCGQWELSEDGDCFEVTSFGPELALRSDGDLWALIACAITQKAHRSVILSTVKSHLHIQHVLIGCLSEWRWAGNAFADECARKASEPKEFWHETLARALDARRDRLERIVRAVQSMHVTILLKASERNAVAKKVESGRPKAFIAVQLPRPPPDTELIEPRRHRSIFGFSPARGTWLAELEAFILQAQWRPVSTPADGMPLLLLLILFEQLTGAVVHGAKMSSPTSCVRLSRSSRSLLLFGVAL